MKCSALGVFHLGRAIFSVYFISLGLQLGPQKLLGTATRGLCRFRDIQIESSLICSKWVMRGKAYHKAASW